MKRIISYKPTLGESLLLMLEGVITATVKTLYPHPYYHLFCRHANPRSLYNALKRLEYKNLVGSKLKGGREGWELTPEGEKAVRVLKAKMEYARVGRWDKKWRMIIFDVPEKIRDRRNHLRKELISFGFHQLQKSVWVSPYPLPSEFFEIMSELNLGNGFRLVVAEKIDSDADLRSIFFPTV